MNQEMTGQESLQIINQMIREARKNLSETSIFFLIWGGLLAAAGLVEFLLIKQGFSAPYIVWPIAGVSGGIISSVIGKKMSIEKGMSTLWDRMSFALWTSFFITLVIFIACCVISDINPGAYIMVLTGLPTITTGIILRFKPLIIGGICFWICGIAGFFISNLYLPLLFTVAITLGYILPGLLLREAERNGSL